MRKKISISILLVILCFLLTACGEKELIDDVNDENSKEIKSIDDIVEKKGTLMCTRSATATNAEPFFSYTVDYKGDEILKLHSIEGITSEDSSVLDEYEDAYKKIASYYKDIEYYDINVKREANKVTWDTTINYKKVDLDELVALEGTQNSIVKDGKANLSSWLELASKVGTTCTEK